jgi:hypothetical protein
MSSIFLMKAFLVRARPAFSLSKKPLLSLLLAIYSSVPKTMKNICLLHFGSPPLGRHLDSRRQPALECSYRGRE